MSFAAHKNIIYHLRNGHVSIQRDFPKGVDVSEWFGADVNSAEWVNSIYYTSCDFNDFVYPNDYYGIDELVENHSAEIIQLGPYEVMRLRVSLLVNCHS